MSLPARFGVSGTSGSLAACIAILGCGLVCVPWGCASSAPEAPGPRTLQPPTALTPTAVKPPSPRAPTPPAVLESVPSGVQVKTPRPTPKTRTAAPLSSAGSGDRVTVPSKVASATPREPAKKAATKKASTVARTVKPTPAPTPTPAEPDPSPPPPVPPVPSPVPPVPQTPPGTTDPPPPPPDRKDPEAGSGATEPVPKAPMLTESDIRERVAEYLKRLRGDDKGAGEAFRELWEVRRELISSLILECDRRETTRLKELTVQVLDPKRFVRLDESEGRFVYDVPGLGRFAYDDVAAGETRTRKSVRAVFRSRTGFPLGVVLRAALINRFRSTDYPSGSDKSDIVGWWQRYHSLVASKL
jgi:hypothetical protein